MIIGLVGSIGSGKGTIADTLVDYHDFFKESFANSVKDAVSVIFGWDRSLLEGDTDESRWWREQKDSWWSEKLKRDFSPRLALQLMGTEAGRDVFHQDLWVYTMLQRLENAPWNDYVIADVRFPNEIKMISDLGGKIVQVNRGEKVAWYEKAYETNTKANYYGMAENFPDVHYSEWAWIGHPKIDMAFDNNCELSQLPRRVDIMLDNLYNKHIDGVDTSEVIL